MNVLNGYAAADPELAGKWLSYDEAVIFSELPRWQLTYLLRRYGLEGERINAAALALMLDWYWGRRYWGRRGH